MRGPTCKPLLLGAIHLFYLFSNLTHSLSASYVNPPCSLEIFCKIWGKRSVSMYVNSRLFSIRDWEARCAHAHYQCATLASELSLSRRTLRRHIASAFHHAPHWWLEAIRQ